MQPNNLSELNSEALMNKIKLDGVAMLSNRIGQQNAREIAPSEILIENAFILRLEDGFETIVVPVINSATNELDIVILGSNIDGEDIYPIIELDSTNGQLFNLSNRIVAEGATADTLVDIFGLEDQVVIIECFEDYNCLNIDGSFCIVCQAYGGGYSGPYIDLLNDYINGNNNGNSNNSGGHAGGNNNNEYEGDNTNGYTGSTGENDNNGETIEQTVIISYTTEQIILELEDCTGKTVSEMNTHLPLSSDQSEFLTALLLENINYYNYEINSLGAGGLPIQNVPTFEELQGIIENLDPNDFPELIEGIVDYLQFYNNYGPSARGAQPNWVNAVSCFASGLFDAEINVEMLNHKASMSAEELEIFNELSMMKQWQYLLSAAQARTAAQELFPFAVPKDCTLLNGPGDAFRHAIWNALCKYRLGWFTAQALTSAHENRPYNYEFQQFEVDMDLFNNEVGLSIDGDNYVSIHQAVLNSYNNGELRMLSNREMVGNLCRATSNSSLIIAN